MYKYLLIFICLLSAQVYAETPMEQNAQQAEKYYYAGDYKMAISKWNNLLVAGVENAWLNYNLANAYYRLGEFNYAKAYYLKAARDLPRDQNIRHNLILIDHPKGQPVDPNLGNLDKLSVYLSKTLTNLQLSYREASYVLALLSVVLAVLKILRRPGVMVCAILYSLMLGYYGYLTWQRYFVHQAVMLNADKLLFEPIKESPQKGVVSAGQLVWVLSEEGQVVLVKDSQGVEGWVNKQNLILL